MATDWNFSHTLRKLSRIHFESSRWCLVPIQLLVCHRQSQRQPKITDKIVFSASASGTKKWETFRDCSTIYVAKKGYLWFLVFTGTGNFFTRNVTVLVNTETDTWRFLAGIVIICTGWWVWFGVSGDRCRCNSDWWYKIGTQYDIGIAIILLRWNLMDTLSNVDAAVVTRCSAELGSFCRIFVKNIFFSDFDLVTFITTRARFPLRVISSIYDRQNSFLWHLSEFKA